MKLLLILLHILSFSRFSFQVNEEFCQNMRRHTIRGEEIFLITGYLDAEYDIRFQLAFEDKVEADDMDFIKVKPGGCEITRKRNGQRLTGTLNATIPMGWVNMNITVDKHQINISPYIDKITFEYSLRELIIASNNRTLCSQEKPSWKIKRDLGVTVFLNGLSRSRISLTSENEFSPIISILGFKFYLSYKSGIILGMSDSKLPANTYTFILENENDTIRLIHQEKECDKKLVLASLQHTNILTNITASTIDEDFTLVLQPVVDDISCETISNSTENYDTLIVGLVLGLLIILLLGLIVYFKLRMRKKKKMTVLLVEEKDKLLEEKVKMNELLKEGKPMEELLREVLWQAASSGDLLRVKAAIRGGAELNYQFSLAGRTPLYAASQGGHLPVVQELLRAGANKDTPSNNGLTPLAIAQKEGHSDVEQELRKAGAQS